MRRSAPWQFILAFVIPPITGKLERTGSLYRREYPPSRGTGLADALIAATTENDADLVIFNRRRFSMFLRLTVPYGR